MKKNHLLRQNASRKVIGCSQITQTNSDNILASNNDHDKKMILTKNTMIKTISCF